MKKFLSIILSIAILATLCSQNIFAYASEVNITVDNINAEYNETFDVPVYVSDNSNLMGFAFEISYDSSKVKPVSVTPVSSLSSGTFNDSIGSDVYVNPIRVVWADTKALTVGGKLFTIRFKSLSLESSEIKISALEADTYNSSYSNVNIPDCIVTVQSLCYHRFIEEVIEPTCTSKGIYVYTCITCGTTFHDYTDELGHNIVTDSAVNPTCTKAGVTEGSHCSVCGTVIVKQQIVDASGHKFGSWENIYLPDCVNNGSQKRVCNDCGYTETININSIGHKWQNDYTTDKVATCYEIGSKSIHCAVCGAKRNTVSIAKPASFSLSSTNYIYDGKVKSPDITVTDENNNIIDACNYTVTYEGDKVNVGMHYVNIDLRGDYSGSAALCFAINPKSANIKSIKAANKGMTVKWKKQAVQTNGYEIQYATNSDFTKNSKLINVSRNSITSKKVSKLKSKTKYYVRIRTYKTVKVNGKSTKIYSNWSKVKTVKIK